MKSIDFFQNKSFCVLPWVNVSTHTNGNVRHCCISDEFVYKDNGEKFNLGVDNLPDIINSEHMINVRKKMLEGSLVKGCDKCYRDEELGGSSNRIWYNKAYLKSNRIFKKIVASSKDGKIENPTVEYFDIRFGNLCNLACRSCYPEASSQFNKEVIKLYPTTKIGNYFNPVNENFNNWCNTETFNENVGSQLKNLVAYYMNGGEPTIIENNLIILQKMIDSGASKNITLSFNSNMTNNKRDFYDLLKHFKQVRFMCSIDGYNKVQEYLRYPSKWSQIDENFQRLLSMKLNNVLIRPTPVVSNINLEYITDLFRYFDDMSAKYNTNIEVLPIILHNPSYLNFCNLPVSYKQMCWEKIERYMETCRTQSEHFYEAMKIVKNGCQEEVDYLPHLSRFFEFNDMLDHSRNQKLIEVNPSIENFRLLI